MGNVLLTASCEHPAGFPTLRDDVRGLGRKNRAVHHSRGDAVDEARALVEQIQQANIALGSAIQRIHVECKDAGVGGKPAFEHLVETEVGVRYRKAMYLRHIHVTFREAGIDERRLSEIGWSKAKEISRIGADNLRRHFDALAKFARSHTREELIDHLDRRFGVCPRRVAVGR